MSKKNQPGSKSQSNVSPSIDNDQLGENVYNEFSELVDLKSDIKSDKKSQSKNKCQ